MYVLNQAVLIEVHVLASPTTTKVHAVAMRSGGREVNRVAEEPEVREEQVEERLNATLKQGKCS